MPVLGVVLACGFPAGDLVSLKQELRKDPYRIGFHTNLLPGQWNLIALQWTLATQRINGWNCEAALIRFREIINQASCFLDLVHTVLISISALRAHIILRPRHQHQIFRLKTISSVKVV
jgi:hypothetical protein